MFWISRFDVKSITLYEYILNQGCCTKFFFSLKFTVFLQKIKAYILHISFVSHKENWVTISFQFPFYVNAIIKRKERTKEKGRKPEEWKCERSRSKLPWDNTRQKKAPKKSIIFPPDFTSQSLTDSRGFYNLKSEKTFNGTKVTICTKFKTGFFIIHCRRRWRKRAATRNYVHVLMWVRWQVS